MYFQLNFLSLADATCSCLKVKNCILKIFGMIFFYIILPNSFVSTFVFCKPFFDLLYHSILCQKANVLQQLSMNALCQKPNASYLSDTAGLYSQVRTDTGSR